jgi:hypothetical protein
MNRLIFILCLWEFSFVLTAQRSFSEDQLVFFNQAVNSIKSIDTEAANKVAFDFQNAWNAKFTSSHKDKIQSIALQMQRKGYVIQPDYWYFFSYLAFSVSQADLNADELTSLLEINDQVIKTMGKVQYQNFLLGLNIFMARRLLVRTKSITVATDDGSFSFKLLDEPVYEEKTNDQLTEPDIYEEPVTEETPADDPWANDTASDPWATDNDPWGTSSDPWGDTASDDPWGDSANDDPWDDNASTEPAAERQAIKGYAENFVKEMELKYQHPTIIGPIIDLVNNSMLIVTPSDSFKIKETSGTYLLNNRTYAGTKATINWPIKYKNALGAVVTLGDYHIKADQANFWTPNAKLNFPGLFTGSVEGVFTFKSPPRSRRTPSAYPMFISNESNAKLEIPGGKMTYTGGVQLSGDQLYGASVSRKKGTLEILDGRGNKVIVRAERFVFKDSTVSTESGEFVIHLPCSRKHAI